VQWLMAVAFVRETPLHDGRNVVDLSTDERSLKALEVIELHALGRATDGELDAARGAAKDAAMDAAGDAAATATWAAAGAGAWAAARGAVRSAALVAAWDAAWASAWDTDGDTDGDEAGDTAEAAAWDAQVEIARRVILLGHAKRTTLPRK